MTRFQPYLLSLWILLTLVTIQRSTPGADESPIRVGIIGLDTSHAIAFTGLLNAELPAEGLANCRVVAAYPQGSTDIESSVASVPKYTQTMRDQGVTIVESIDALLPLVDAVLLETNDGRPHLEQAIPVLKARKPTFIDKPMAGSLTDVLALFELARQYNTRVFTSSALRYGNATQEVRNGALGPVMGCDTYAPCTLEPNHPDFFWYGIHGVESLFTVMGAGCDRVTRIHTPEFDVAVGTWKDGRLGSFRGIRKGAKSYGGIAFGTSKTMQIGTFDGYQPLVKQIVAFFRGTDLPITEQEMIEIYAFMEAADESKRQGGAAITLESVLHRARQELRTRAPQRK